MLRALPSALLAAFVLVCALRAQPVGSDAATHTFRQSPFNAYGLASLEELRGKPVLVEFWGTR